MLKLSFQQQVLAGFAATVFGGIILAVTSLLSINRLHNDADWVSKTERVIIAAKQINIRVLEAESGARGYAASGGKTYLEAFHFHAQQLDSEINSLKLLTADNPAQLLLIDSLQQYVSVRINRLNDIVDARRQLGVEAASQILVLQNVLEERERVSLTLQKIIKSENILLQQRKHNTERSVVRTIAIVVIGSLIVFALLTLLFYYIKKTFARQKLIEERVRQTNSQLQKISKENEYRNWQLTGTSILNKSMRGQMELQPLSHNIITSLAKYLNASIGALYIYDSETTLLLTAGFGFDIDESPYSSFKLGEGMVGQAAAEKQRIVFNNIPKDYIKVTSSFGESLPKTIVIQPFLFNDKLKGVIELGFLQEIHERELEFIRRAVVSIGIAINTAQDRVKVIELYEQTQHQAEELESQHEELLAANEELKHKTEMLQSSEEELQVQQEELRVINSELEEKAEQLEERNRVIEEAREAVNQKVKELENSNRYKSDFLANMSHELRTPLNSILILARILQENKNGNLSEEQMKYAGVIKSAGTDLLNLINDILDLSKIEAGKIDLTFENINAIEISSNMMQLFKEVAAGKNISFNVLNDKDLPAGFFSDKFRIEQILKNLLSNAFKFTPNNGSVALRVYKNTEDEEFKAEYLKQYAASGKPVIAFQVVDTGIGIPEDKQQSVFGAFHQADGSTTRKYGGTGLGLSISLQLAVLLGGEIKLQSEPGSGSVFTLFLPLEMPAPLPKESKSETTDSPAAEAFIPQPLGLRKPGKEKKEEPAILIIEDDVNFAAVLKEYAIEKGFKPLLAYDGNTGLELAKKEQPDAIILDIILPGMDGWDVLRRLKEDPSVQAIPVHLMSASDNAQQEAIQRGALGFLQKPLSKDVLDNVFNLLMHNSGQLLEKVLIIEDHEIQNNDLRSQLLKKNVKVEQAFNGDEALSILSERPDFDCIILDINLPDISGLDLLDRIKAQPGLSAIPIVVNTAMELNQNEIERVLAHTQAMVLKNSKSNDRLQDEIDLFLNRIKNEQIKQYSYSNTGRPRSPVMFEQALKNKSILVVDDDMRNVFALNGILEMHGLNIQIAMNGREALKKLDENPDTNLVLMDIMMPEMDGYEAIAAIRKQKRFNKLPVIALTAKAMKNDREKCIEAGASDYISKPIDIDKLLSLIRVWLS